MGCGHSPLTAGPWKAGTSPSSQRRDSASAGGHLESQPGCSGEGLSEGHWSFDDQTSCPRWAWSCGNWLQGVPGRSNSPVPGKLCHIQAHSWTVRIALLNSSCCLSQVTLLALYLRLGWLYSLSTKLGHFWEWKGAWDNRCESGVSWGNLDLWSAQRSVGSFNHFVGSLTKNDSVQRGLCVEGPRPSRGGEGVTQGPFLRFLFTAQRAFQLGGFRAVFHTPLNIRQDLFFIPKLSHLIFEPLQSHFPRRAALVITVLEQQNFVRYKHISLKGPQSVITVGADRG